MFQEYEGLTNKIHELQQKEMKLLDQMGLDSVDLEDSEPELDEDGNPIRRRRRKEPVDKDALKAAKKEHKAKVKAEAAEKRKTKIPKHLKKKATARNKKK